MTERSVHCTAVETTNDELRGGVEAFFSMMEAIQSLPGFARPGFTRDENGSVVYDLPAAVGLVEEAIASAPRVGFVLAMADYFQSEMAMVSVDRENSRYVYEAIDMFREAAARTVSRGSAR